MIRHIPAAYHYRFSPTGIPEIDDILSAICHAGREAHHTEEWNTPGPNGETPVDRIQEAADEAAEAWKKRIEVYLMDEDG